MTWHRPRFYCHILRCAVEPSEQGHLITCPQGRWLAARQGHEHAPEADRG